MPSILNLENEPRSLERVAPAPLRSPLHPGRRLRLLPVPRGRPDA